MPGMKQAKQMEESSPELLDAMMMDGGTGGSILHSIVTEVTVKARLVLLFSGLLLLILSLLYGYWVWEDTQSLTIEVDLLALGCDVTAILINIGTEVIKPRLKSKRSVVIADLTGGLMSLALLVVVGVMGVMDAMQASKDLKEHNPSPTRHLEKLLRYGAFALCLSLANLGIFASLHNLLLPKDGDVHDQLNILSYVAHSCIDFISNFAVFGASIWLQYGIPNQEMTWREMRENLMWVDVFGSFAIVACILISICVLFREISLSIEWVRSHPAGQEAGCAASGSYGTMAA